MTKGHFKIYFHNIWQFIKLWSNEYDGKRVIPGYLGRPFLPTSKEEKKMMFGKEESHCHHIARESTLGYLRLERIKERLNVNWSKVNTTRAQAS